MKMMRAGARWRIRATRVALSAGIASLCIAAGVRLFFPIRFLSEEAEGGGAPGQNKAFGTYCDSSLVLHTRTDLSPGAPIHFRIENRSPLLALLCLEFGLATPGGGQKTVLALQCRPQTGDGRERILRVSASGDSKPVHAALWPLPRSSRLSLSCAGGPAVIHDLRVVPLPLPPLLYGAVFLIAAAVLRRGAGEAPSMQPRSRRCVFALILVGLMTACVAGSLEIFLRLFPTYRPAKLSAVIRSYPLQARRFLYTGFMPDDALAFKRRPHFRARYRYEEGNLFEMKETALRSNMPIEVDGRYDADGFPNRKERKDAEIVFLGDSILDDYRPTPNICELFEKLSGMTVANLAHSCTGTLQQRLIFERYALKKHPRRVVLAFFEGNDYPENEYFIKYLQKPESKYSLYSENFFSPAPIALTYRPIQKSYLFLLLEGMAPILQNMDAYTQVLPGRPPSRPEIESPAVKPGDACSLFGATNDVPFIVQGRTVRMAFLPSYAKRLADPPAGVSKMEGWGIATRETETIHTQCRENGIRFSVCFIPEKANVYFPSIYRSLGEACFDRYLAALLHVDGAAFRKSLLSYHNTQRDLLRDFCSLHDIPFLDLSDALARRSTFLPLLYYANDTHLSPEGHRVVGEALWEWIKGLPK